MNNSTNYTTNTPITNNNTNTTSNNNSNPIRYSQFQQYTNPPAELYADLQYEESVLKQLRYEYLTELQRLQADQIAIKQKISVLTNNK